VTLDNILWLAGDGVAAIVVALLIRGREFRTFPIFSSYLVWSLLSDVAQFAARHFYPASFYDVYVIGLIIDSFFQFGVLVELSWSVLRPLRSALPRWTMAVVAAAITLIGAAVWPLVSGPVASGFSLAGRLFFHVQGTFAILRILFFLLLAGCSQLLSIGWRDRELQIATGLGFYSLVSIAVWMLHSGHTWGPLYHLLDQIAAVSYVCSLAYWAFSFAQKEAVRREFTPQMENFLLAVAGTARTTRIALTDSSTQRNRDRRQ
jgi:hypothetical protein